MNIFTAFSRAAQGLPLTPQERAWLKLVWGAVVTAFIAAIGVVSSLLATGQFAFNQQTAIAVGVAGFVALLNALAKLISANGDPMLGVAVGALAGQIAAHTTPPASSTPISIALDGKQVATALVSNLPVVKRAPVTPVTPVTPASPAAPSLASIAATSAQTVADAVNAAIAARTS